MSPPEELASETTISVATSWATLEDKGNVAEALPLDRTDLIMEEVINSLVEKEN